MDNISIITVFDSILEKDIEHIIIDRGNGEYTSMLKSTYDAQQVEHLTDAVE